MGVKITHQNKEDWNHQGYRWLLYDVERSRRLFNESQIWWQQDGNCLTATWGLSVYCLMAAWWLPDDCLRTAWGLPEDCLRTAWGLPEDCLTTAWQLPANCLITAWLLPYDWLTTTCQLPDWLFNKCCPDKFRNCLNRTFCQRIGNFNEWMADEKLVPGELLTAILSMNEWRKKIAHMTTTKNTADCIFDDNKQ